MDNGAPYDYTSAGFDKFFDRSVEGTPQINLDSPSAPSQTIRYDDHQISGPLGDAIQVGNIKIDGVKGRISFYDDTGSEVARLGELDD